MNGLYMLGRTDGSSLAKEWVSNYRNHSIKYQIFLQILVSCQKHM